MKKSKKGPIIVTKNGKPVAILLGVTDEEEMERLVLLFFQISNRFTSRSTAD
ncbi:MAG: type II toxin-antitoxin system prevent-host-death family antitoxin [Desulfobacterales bacterium]|nr:type II toxin-antitoxin system prevent-host-death family antitoxin [Desulfobacterales bacterium]